MSASVETIPLAAKPRNRSIATRRAARVGKALKERRIVDLLNRGVSVAEIAAREGVTEKRMRALVKDILARRMPAPPAEYAALQVGRLNEALLVAYGAMSDGNLQAVDRVVGIVRELDRYHGFVASDRRAIREPIQEEAQEPLAIVADRPDADTRRRQESPSAAALAASSRREFPLAAGQGPRAPDASPTDSLQTPLQDPEKTTFATGEGMDPAEPGEAFGPHLAGPIEDARETAARQNNRLETAPQAPEKAQSAPGNGAGCPHEAAPLTDYLGMAPQDAERIESARASGCAPDSPDEAPSPLSTPAQDIHGPDGSLDGSPAIPEPSDRCHARESGHPAATGSEGSTGAAAALDPGVRGGDSVEPPLAPLTSRNEIAPQPPEIAGFDPLSGMIASPPVVGPGGFRLLKLRMLPNGVAAC